MRYKNLLLQLTQRGSAHLGRLVTFNSSTCLAGDLRAQCCFDHVEFESSLTHPARAMLPLISTPPFTVIRGGPQRRTIHQSQGSQFNDCLPVRVEMTVSYTVCIISMEVDESGLSRSRFSICRWAVLNRFRFLDFRKDKDRRRPFS